MKEYLDINKAEALALLVIIGVISFIIYSAFAYVPFSVVIGVGIVVLFILLLCGWCMFGLLSIDFLRDKGWNPLIAILFILFVEISLLIVGSTIIDLFLVGG